MKRILLAALAPAVALGLAASLTPAGAACINDAYDPNNTCADAEVMPLGSYSNLYIAPTAVDQDWYKVWVQRNGTLAVDLSFTHANGDIDLRLYDACGGTLLAASLSTTNAEHVAYKNTGLSRYYYVWVTMISGTCNTYAMDLKVTSTTNVSAIYQPPGWAAPMVPSNVNTNTLGSVPLSATLPGEGATYLNEASNVTGDNTPAFPAPVFLDDTVFVAFAFDDNSAAGLWTATNAGPYTVRGGRHTLRHEIDPDNVVAESNENDNTWSNQWVWSPLTTAYDAPNVRVVPPLKGAGLHANADGSAYTRQSGVAWVVAEAATHAGDDYDLRVFSDYSGSTSGYSNEIGNSVLAGQTTDLVVGHYSATPTTVYPAVERFSAGTGEHYVLDQGDARGKNGSLIANTSASFTPIVMPANRLADVFEANMTSGATYYLSLRQLSGASAIGFRVFPGTVGGIYSLFQGAASVPVGNVYQTLTYVAGESGWHPIVVYRMNGIGADTPLSYDFEWSTAGLVDVPAPPASPDFALAGAAPNPIRERGEIRYTLPAAGHVSLAVFDVNGRLVRTLRDGAESAGAHAVAWNADGAESGRVAAGVYWVRLRFDTRTLTRRIAVLP